MQLDYKHNINEYGDNVVRLYAFNKAEAILFRDCLQKSLLTNKKSLTVSDLEFIESHHCSLTLRLSTEDLGISTVDRKKFVCDLTSASYQKMILLLEPFCTKESKSFQMLYDVDSLTDLLFSPSGTA